ncbi:MAG: histidinol-phosphate transaminase [Bacteroidetes bacterium]|nr:histidinol-phosphate transaminase [Bacteroidota bacterium]
MSHRVPERLLELIRPAVRAEKPYIVPGTRPVAVKLNQNESPFDLPPSLKRELLEAFFQIDFNRYPSEQPARLIQALESHCGVESGSVLVGNGSNELTYTLGLCFVGDGDAVLTPTPMFALYESMVRLHGGRPIPVQCRPDFQVDTSAILDAIRKEQPKLVILATPNNPTGLAIPKVDIERIIKAAPGFVVIDEAYHEFNPEGAALDLLMRYPNVIILRTLSKAFGLAGLRLGYLVARPDVVAEMMKSRLPFMVDRLAEQVGLLMLRHQDLVHDRVQQIRFNTQTLYDTLVQIRGVDEVLPTDTNFLLFRTARDPGELLNALADRDVLVRNMAGYPQLKGFLRVTSGTPSENKAFLDALTATLR